MRRRSARQDTGPEVSAAVAGVWSGSLYAPLGQLVAVDDGAAVLCHACGRGFAFLAGHVSRHGLTAPDYREMFQLGRSTALSAPQLLAARRLQGLERYASNARLRAGLAVGQAMARSGELLELSHAVQQHSPVRLERRLRASRSADRSRTVAAADDRLRARLVALGYPNDQAGFLHDRYVVRGRPMHELASELSVGHERLARLLDEAGIVRRRPGGADTAHGRSPRTG